MRRQLDRNLTKASVPIYFNIRFRCRTMFSACAQHAISRSVAYITEFSVLVAHLFEYVGAACRCDQNNMRRERN